MADITGSPASEDVLEYSTKQMLTMAQEFAEVVIREMGESSRWSGTQLPNDAIGSIVAKVASTFSEGGGYFYSRSQTRKMMEFVFVLCRNAYEEAVAGAQAQE